MSQQEDARDLFEKVFQKLDKDSSKTVSRSEFQEYFKPDRRGHNREDDGGGGAAGGSPILPVPVQPTTQPSPVLEQDEEWEDVQNGCCGGGGKRLKPRPQPQTVAPAQPQLVVPATATSAPPAVAQFPPPLIQQQPYPASIVPATAVLNPYSSAAAAAAAAAPGADLFPEKLRDELMNLRTQLKSRGDTQRTKDLRLADMEMENNRLRAEYNLQSLKQDMLVHMWSMHMLDADQEEDM